MTRHIFLIQTNVYVSGCPRECKGEVATGSAWRREIPHIHEAARDAQERTGDKAATNGGGDNWSGWVVVFFFCRQDTFCVLGDDFCFQIKKLLGWVGSAFNELG